MPNFDVRGINFTIAPAEIVGNGRWEDFQDLQGEAFKDALPNRTDDEVNEMLHWYNLGAYIEGRVDPQTDVARGKLRAGQSFGKPIVAWAESKDKDVVGYAYAADNVSGRLALERYVKRVTPFKRYVWLREIAVDESYRDRGIAHIMGYLLLSQHDQRQPVSAYIWEELNGFENIVEHMKNLGFEPNPPQTTEVKPFGEKADPAQQLRLEAPSVAKVKNRMELGAPGSLQAIRRARENTLLLDSSLKKI